MLFTIEKYVLRKGTCVVRRLLSSSAHTDFYTNAEEPEFILRPEDQFTKIRRDESKCLRVALLGYPNVGKSTIVNRLIYRSVCPVSHKAHTTMHKSEAIYSEGNTQLIFMDTPGLVTPSEIKKFKLKDTFSKDPSSCIKIADIVGVVQDASNIYTREKIHKCVLNVIGAKREHVPLILILNKVDFVKKKSALLHITKVLTEKQSLLKFDDVFMISALNGDGIDDLRNYFLDSAESKDWQYKGGVYTNQSPEKIVEETVRAKMLDTLPQEMPYQLQIQLEHLGTSPDGSISAVVNVHCRKVKIGTLLLKSQRIKTVALQVEEELRHAFQTSVIVKLAIKFPEKN